MAKFTIAFDFDGTISEDPEAFLFVMNHLRYCGHNVIVVTGRKETTSPWELDFLRENNFMVYFTNHIAKRRFMRSLGIEVNIWVDDIPEAMLEDWDGPPRTYKGGRIVIKDAA